MKKKDDEHVEKKADFSLEQYVDEIRQRAKEIFLTRGEDEGDALSDWLQAEKEIKKKYNIE
ncbi:MAG: hypothetical protein CVV24_10265 [Ignavibacteriae bacterium HGW-Ignavibacteriae-3]|nr:MAG: hypothetical protein CVV24_10265 [Ignavibacteriae bacterium HGW-Ignavibacteriae-3]